LAWKGNISADIEAIAMKKFNGQLSLRKKQGIQQVRRALSLVHGKEISVRLQNWRRSAACIRDSNYEAMIKDLRHVLESERALREHLETEFEREMSVERELRVHVERELREEIGDEREVRRHIEQWASGEGQERAEAYSLVNEMRETMRRERERRSDAEDALRLEIRARKAAETEIRELLLGITYSVKEDTAKKSEMALEATLSEIAASRKEPRPEPGVVLSRLMNELKTRASDLCAVLQMEREARCQLENQLEEELIHTGQLEADRLAALDAQGPLMMAIDRITDRRSNAERLQENLPGVPYSTARTELARHEPRWDEGPQPLPPYPLRY